MPPRKPRCSCDGEIRTDTPARPTRWRRQPARARVRHGALYPTHLALEERRSSAFSWRSSREHRECLAQQVAHALELLPPRLAALTLLLFLLLLLLLPDLGCVIPPAARARAAAVAGRVAPRSRRSGELWRDLARSGRWPTCLLRPSPALGLSPRS